MRALVSLILLMIVCQSIAAQDHDYLPHYDRYHLLEKAYSLTGRAQKQPFFSQIKPLSRLKAVEMLKGSPGDSLWKQQLYNDAPEYSKVPQRDSDQSFGSHFYQSEADFFTVQEEGFDLHINPVWQFGVGNDPGVSNRLFVNSRGFDLRGTIDKRVSFSTRFIENQVQYPAYVKDVADSIGLVPYEGFWKEYNETTTDFFRAFGYVDVGVSKHISAQLGFGRHFIGNGIRSMVLSDFGNSYPYLKVNTQIWKISYTNIFAELIADAFTFDGGTLGASRYPKKYLASHTLEIEITPNFHFGLFETVIMGKPDSLGGSRFEFAYLNPIIFYRAVEQQDGSFGNALLGATFRWDIKKKINIYGQFLLDELIISELKAGNDWWGNKYGYQVGMQVFDLGLVGLDLKIEHNAARPYTYSHQDVYTAYTHYDQPLAHPLGANFREWLLQVYYQPHPKWELHLHGVHAKYGADQNGIYFGQNPHTSYNLRPQDYGQQLLQGNTGTLNFVQSRVSYQWRHNIYADAYAIIRQESFETSLPDQNSTIFGVGFRINMPYRNYLF
ncbi:MAG: hypothetical protein ACI8QD_000012 [Cyclobacteriaceae bacterium]